MKRLISLLLTLCLAVSLVSGAAAASDDTMEQTVRALGIITGDENGNMNLSANVTRAQFAKMMTAASTYKDTIGESAGVSLFRDLKKDHWAVEYVKVAVEQGWFLGYVDGTFQPDRTITLEEGATAVLRLLGWTSDKLGGSYPAAQLSKAGALGLLDGISKTRGQTLTRQDCMVLFYNLMTTKTSGSQAYASTLGYSLNTAGELSYASLVEAGMKGPYVLDGSSLSASLPFSSSNVTVYRNGRSSTLSEASRYDVYYYNSNLRTVWLYTSRVTGLFTATSPSSTSPSSVTVAGGSYTLGTSAASYKLSDLGGFSYGDTVTLLLGREGDVVDVISAADTDGIYYGVVQSGSKSSYTDSDGTLHTEYFAQVICTDGTVRQFATGQSLYSGGELVSITFTSGQSKATKLNARSVTGTVNSAGTKLGELSFAGNIEILEADAYGNYASVYPSRLKGAALDSSDVRYYVQNESGEIVSLILGDVTGDLHRYGLLTEVSEISGQGTSLRGTYAYLMNGEKKTHSTSDRLYNVTTGAAIFINKDGDIGSIKNLTGVTLSYASELYAMNGEKKLLTASGVQTYLKSGSEYHLVSLSSVSDTEKYSLQGYYDNQDFSAGGRIRIIVATAK